MDRKNILVFIMGAVMGSLVTALYMSEKHARFLEEEAEWCEKMAETVRDAGTKEEVVEEPKEKVLVMNKDLYKKDISMLKNITNKYADPAESLHPEDDDEEDYSKYSKMSDVSKNKDPYIITFEGFCESKTNHDTLTITYYQGDDTLVDENEEIIENRKSVIGDDALSSFGEGSDDPNVVYVRNEKMAIDYEVILVEGSYSEAMEESKES